MRDAAHAERADAFTAGWRARRSAHTPHPIDDFLFTYYPTKPSKLRVWHPGVGVVLEAAPEFEGRRGYRGIGDGGVEVDAAAMLTRLGERLDRIETLVRRTLARPARFGCFGLHEWAMVYRQTPDEVRHGSLPLRLGHAGTDAVVEAHHLACTHMDAFRFFTPAAVPRNPLQLTRAMQPDVEQPGCLHANMDVFQQALQLGPIVPGELLLDAFELAREIRTLDMCASPYDVSDYGLAPVAVETLEGKRAYAAAQCVFAERANALRGQLLDVIDAARAQCVADGSDVADTCA